MHTHSTSSYPSRRSFERILRKINRKVEVSQQRYSKSRPVGGRTSGHLLLSTCRPLVTFRVVRRRLRLLLPILDRVCINLSLVLNVFARLDEFLQLSRLIFERAELKSDSSKHLAGHGCDGCSAAGFYGMMKASSRSTHRDPKKLHRLRVPNRTPFA